MDGLGDAEKEFWTRFDAAVAAWSADLPDGTAVAGVISRHAAELFDQDVSDRTISGWIDSRRLPRHPEQMMVMMRVIGADRAQDWPRLLDRARAAQTARLRATPTRDTTPAGKNSDADAVDGDGASGPPASLASTSTSTGRAGRRRRLIGAGLAVALTAVTIAVFAISGQSPSRTATDTARPTASRNGGTASEPTRSSVEQEDNAKQGVPCRPGGAPVGSTPAGTAVPVPRTAGGRPVAYAPGGAGHAELFASERRIVLSDDLSDGCSTILAAQADGSQVGPWANSRSRTGTHRDGTTVPPKTVDLPWLAGTRRLEFRVCLGEVEDRRIQYQDRDCGPWTVVDQPTTPQS
ncbi:hypothetical protein BBK82_44945 [Lentzea guizhouensis]|uniref:Uncharacterized protein n=1 Tax=Lentzea guizhouensis TaxID=1586287 RepID=A0A1B2HWE1_9PSEU|nr:hypothetical protein [Lentzea guizhouensis]ANZ42023.1 hypothetical protein BBK82_44945 [Lentzea guizhouensis]